MRKSKVQRESPRKFSEVKSLSNWFFSTEGIQSVQEDVLVDACSLYEFQLV